MMIANHYMVHIITSIMDAPTKKFTSSSEIPTSSLRFTQETGAHMLLFEDFGESLSKIMSSLTSNDLDQTKKPDRVDLVFIHCWKRTCFF